MKRKNTEANRLKELCKRAEVNQSLDTINIHELSLEEVNRLVYDLRTHQIELEMQNEELCRAQDELVESRDRYSNLYDFAPIGYGTVSNKGMILEANLTLATMLGVERSILVNHPLAAFILPADQDIYYRHRKEIIELKQSYSCQLRMITKDAEPLWVEMETNLIRSDEVDDFSFRTVITDITKRIQAEQVLQSHVELQKLLIQEIDHRVRNNLSTLITLIKLSRTGARTIDELATAMQSRVQAIAAIHSVLSTAEWRGGDMEKMLREIVKPVKRTHIKIAGPQILIPLCQAQAVGLIINELTTNSIKYGAMSVDNAIVSISWEKQITENDKVNLIMYWRETGGPQIENEQNPGTGTSLIQRLTRYELHGQSELTYPTEGAIHTLRFTLATETTSQFNLPFNTVLPVVHLPAPLKPIH